MNVLVTNTHMPQAYAIIRALRPHATTIVASIEGESPLARLSHAAHSRLVDARRRLPSPVADWQHANISLENTRAEQGYLDALLRVCERDNIDVVFPSWDPYVYVLSKNKERLTNAGIIVPVPELTGLLTALDKFRTIEAGQRAGFPCPRTYLYESEDQLRRIANDEQFPLVIKPRFTSGGRGMEMARNREELCAMVPPIAESYGAPMIQEYIPGGERGSVQFVIGRGGEVLFGFRKSRHRKFRRTARYGTVSESADPEEHVQAASGLMREIGCWGAIGVETIHDPRDGVRKLMEVNPRFPRQLWNRTELGINEPLMCIQIARGESVHAVAGYPLGVLFVSPVEDVQLLALQMLDLFVYKARTAFGRAPLDRLSAPPPLRAQLRAFLRSYSGAHRKVWILDLQYFFQDPTVSLMWWLQFSTWIAGGWKQLGK